MPPQKGTVQNRRALTPEEIAQRKQKRYASHRKYLAKHQEYFAAWKKNYAQERRQEKKMAKVTPEPPCLPSDPKTTYDALAPKSDNPSILALFGKKQRRVQKENKV